jgi:serine/threonine-protein kinase
VQFVRSTALIAALVALAPGAALAQQASLSGPEAADASSQAEALAARGFEAYKKGDYTTALSMYAQVLQVAPTAAIYFNIASIYDKKLPDRQLALEFYRKTINAADTTPDLTVKATARIQALNQEQPGEPASKKEEQAASSEETREGKEKQKEAPAEPPLAQDRPGQGLRIAGLLVGGAGIVAVGVGLGFGADAMSKLDSANEICDGPRCATQQGADDMTTAGSSAGVATALCIAGGAAIGAGVVLYLIAPSKPAATEVGGLRLAPVVGPSQAEIHLSGTFF